MLQGKIISNITNTYCVEANNKIYNCIVRGKFKKEDISPVVGDNVEIEVINEEKIEAVIEKIMPRRNFIKRPKLANITQLIFVVSAKMPKPDLLLLDKQLAFAKYLNINSIIVFNKTDLENVSKYKEIYEQIGYTVLETQACNGQGVYELIKMLNHHISAFSGNSGVGKSTLLNRIFLSNMNEEGNISKKSKKGKNTTTYIKLFKFSDNTYIADTPGFATFEISEIESKELYKFFIEFEKYEKECEFVGCTHIKEESCGIRQAVKDGKINEIRYNNYVKIYEQLKDKEEHKW